MEPVTAIRNVGPAMEAAFARAGITTADQVRALGADAAYAALIAAGERPHFISYYVLVMGLMGRPWNDCAGAEKEALRVRFDALKAQAAGRHDTAPPGIESILNEIGVIPSARVRR